MLGRVAKLIISPLKYEKNEDISSILNLKKNNSIF